MPIVTLCSLICYYFVNKSHLVLRLIKSNDSMNELPWIIFFDRLLYICYTSINVVAYELYLLYESVHLSVWIFKAFQKLHVL